MAIFFALSFVSFGVGIGQGIRAAGIKSSRTSADDVENLGLGKAHGLKWKQFREVHQQYFVGIFAGFVFLAGGIVAMVWRDKLQLKGARPTEVEVGCVQGRNDQRLQIADDEGPERSGPVGDMDH